MIINYNLFCIMQKHVQKIRFYAHEENNVYTKLNFRYMIIVKYLRN